MSFFSNIRPRVYWFIANYLLLGRVNSVSCTLIVMLEWHRCTGQLFYAVRSAITATTEPLVNLSHSVSCSVAPNRFKTPFTLWYWLLTSSPLSLSTLTWKGHATSRNSQNMWFPTRAPLEPTLHLQRILRYSGPHASDLRALPFRGKVIGVTVNTDRQITWYMPTCNKGWQTPALKVNKTSKYAQKAVKKRARAANVCLNTALWT